MARAGQFDTLDAIGVTVKHGHTRVRGDRRSGSVDTRLRPRLGRLAWLAAPAVEVPRI